MFSLQQTIVLLQIELDIVFHYLATVVQLCALYPIFVLFSEAALITLIFIRSFSAVVLFAMTLSQIMVDLLIDL
jgi:hypothetical protein